jgi:AmmeMemoRadiSam system protein B
MPYYEDLEPGLQVMSCLIWPGYSFIYINKTIPFHRMHAMTQIRTPAVAGMFYPGDHQELEYMVTGMLDAVPAATAPPIKAIIAPHAGYIYSGPVAASAYARLKQQASTIQRVVLLGPSHRVPFRGLAVSSADIFQTPLGPVAIDVAAVQRVADLPQVTLLDEAHTLEHSLEVHLPFLQLVLDDFQLIPMVVGDATGEQVSEVLDMVWGGDETLIVISSDLSHYHDYETARKMDQRTCEAIESMHPEKIHFDDACGRIPVSGLLLSARRHGLHAHTLDLRNSGDTAGPRDQVVGYGAWIFN